jgi:hypothetical protein
VVKVLSLAAASTSNAGYVVVGAAIAATASLLAVGLKALLDRQAERERHARDIEKLRFESDEKRTDALIERRQRAFATALAATHQIYDDVRAARRRRRVGELDDGGYLSELKGISAREGQVSMEELRLLASESTVNSADALWHHLRSSDVPGGRELSSAAWVTWKQTTGTCGINSSRLVV